MKAQAFIDAITAPPELQDVADRKIVRHARVRMVLVDGAWEFEPPQGVTTYYVELEVQKPKDKSKGAKS